MLLGGSFWGEGDGRWKVFVGRWWAGAPGDFVLGIGLVGRIKGEEFAVKFSLWGCNLGLYTFAFGNSPSYFIRIINLIKTSVAFQFDSLIG